ncbi:MAG: pseudouridine synthase, partial [Parasphingorhabdus sp.]
MAHIYAMTAGQSIKSGIVPEIEKKQRLDAALAGFLGDLSRERIKQLISSGNLSIGGAVFTDPASKKCAGKPFALTVPEQVDGPAEAQDIPLDIVFEDDYLIIVNKPAGLVVHPAPGHRQGTLLNALLHFDQNLSEIPRAGLVHRLDQDTTGVMVVARSLRAHTSLVGQLQDRSMNRT